MPVVRALERRVSLEILALAVPQSAYAQRVAIHNKLSAGSMPDLWASTRTALGSFGGPPGRTGLGGAALWCARGSSERVFSVSCCRRARYRCRSQRRYEPLLDEALLGTPQTWARWQLMQTQPRYGRLRTRCAPAGQVKPHTQLRDSQVQVMLRRQAKRQSATDKGGDQAAISELESFHWPLSCFWSSFPAARSGSYTRAPHVEKNLGDALKVSIGLCMSGHLSVFIGYGPRRSPLVLEHVASLHVYGTHEHTL